MRVIAIAAVAATLAQAVPAADLDPARLEVVGADNLVQTPLVTAAEDFSFFAQRVPGFYFFVGVTPATQDPATAPSNHSDLFYLDERGIDVGLRAMTRVVVDYLKSGGVPK